MTLDAGGTNFVFSAIQGNKQIIDPIRLYPNSDNLDKCLETIIYGFEIVKKELEIPGTDKKIAYDPFLRTGVGISKNSTSNNLVGSLLFCY